MTGNINVMQILVISSKDSYAGKRLAEEARRARIELKIVTPNKLKGIVVKNFDCLYVRNPFVKGSPKYLPDIISMAKRFKAAGKKVVDQSVADGKLAQGKWVDYQMLKKAGLPIPKTDLKFKVKDLTYPFIAKWIYGFKGKHIFLVNNEAEFHLVAQKYPADELQVQEFISAEYEYKVITVGYKALPVILRFGIHPLTHRPDFSTACSVPIYGPSGKPINRHATQLVTLSQKASRVLGRELAKVDILESRGRFYILEVNRFPGLDSFEMLTKFNVIQTFLAYLSRTN